MQQISVPEHNDLTLFLVCAEVFVMARLGVVPLDSFVGYHASAVLSKNYNCSGFLCC